MGANELRLGRFHMNRPIVPDAHHFGDAARIVPIGLYGAGRKKSLRLAGFDTDRIVAVSDQVAVQPFRKRTGLQTYQVDLITPGPKLLSERPGFGVHFALPYELPVPVQHADGDLLQGDIEANNFAHGSLRSVDDRLRAYRGQRPATDYPI
jgi:hypothetical protein